MSFVTLSASLAYIKVTLLTASVINFRISRPKHEHTWITCQRRLIIIYKLFTLWCYSVFLMIDLSASESMTVLAPKLVTISYLRWNTIRTHIPVTDTSARKTGLTKAYIIFANIALQLQVFSITILYSTSCSDTHLPFSKSEKSITIWAMCWWWSTLFFKSFSLKKFVFNFTYANFWWLSIA